LNDYRAHLNDLRSLANGSKPESFNSGTRKQEYAFFIRQKIERETNLSKASKDLERNQILFDKKIISEEEYDFFSYEYKKAENELASLTDSQISKWQNELNVYTNVLAEMETARMQEMKDKDLYAVLSPLTGTLDQFRGIYAGSNVQAGATLAILSPDSSLYAEIYASPRNIGYLHVGMQVKMQISAFNYNEWGSIAGEVTDISSDFLTGKSETNYYYVVKCKMNSHCLTRKNGAKGILKKGMTVSSHFMITRRSLFDLLYQKMDDWINPAQLKT
jgi:multidrug resistance efflux pump